jgi:hypothetical protein
MEFDGSLPHSRESFAGPYAEPDQLVPYHPILSLQDPFCYYPPTCIFVFVLVSFLIKRAFPFSIRPACPAHLILLDLINLSVLNEEYRLRSLSCNCLHPPITSSLFGPNILLRSFVSNTLSMFFPKR